MGNVTKEIQVNEIDNKIISFFSVLESEQKPLESEFRIVLEDNLWDLYQT